MSDPKPMPRQAVIAAGGLIVLAAVAGLAMGVARNFQSKGGLDTDTGEVVAPIKAATATALVAPPVTEADVRRWAREEMAAQHAAAPKKPKAEADAGADGPDAPTPPTVVPATPAAPGNTTAPKPAATPQIPF